MKMNFLESLIQAAKNYKDLRRREEERKSKLAPDVVAAAEKKIIFMIRSEGRRGFKITKDHGVVSAVADMRSEAEKLLKVDAASLGANAITCLYYKHYDGSTFWEGKAVTVIREG